MRTKVNDKEDKMKDAVKQAVELMILKSQYACGTILQKHGLLGENNTCLYAGLLEAAFDCDETTYFVDCIDAVPNIIKQQTTYKYVIYRFYPNTDNKKRIASGQKTIKDLV